MAQSKTISFSTPLFICKREENKDANTIKLCSGLSELALSQYSEQQWIWSVLHLSTWTQQKTNYLMSAFKTEAAELVVSMWEFSSHLFFYCSTALPSKWTTNPWGFPHHVSHLAEQIVFVWLCAHISCECDALNHPCKWSWFPDPCVPFYSLWEPSTSHILGMKTHIWQCHQIMFWWCVAPKTVEKRVRLYPVSLHNKPSFQPRTLDEDLHLVQVPIPIYFLRLRPWSQCLESNFDAQGG